MALQIVSSIDNSSYLLCKEGYFGKHLQERSYEVKSITLKDSSNRQDIARMSPHRKRLPFHAFIVLVIFFLMVTGWGIILHGQVSGIWYQMKYPQCQVKLQQLDIREIGDGKCNGGLYNRYECGFDGGGEQ